jgi:hypothetical protein
MTTKEVKAALEGVVDTIGKNKAGNFVARRGYFYRHGQSAETFASDVQKALPQAVIVNKWDKWTAFRGGASTANQSHFGVEFAVNGETKEAA